MSGGQYVEIPFPNEVWWDILHCHIQRVSGLSSEPPPLFFFRGAVIKTRIKPELDLEKYNDSFNELIKLYPERYRPLKIRYFQDKINRLQNEITREEARIERDELMKNKSISINPTKWEEFAISDKHGVESVKETYHWYLINNCISEEWLSEIESILQLRTEKWEGVNDDLHECYLSLLKGLNKDFKKKEVKNDDLPF